MSKIAKINAREILDSRGNPTVEVDVVTEAGVLGRAAVPSGASTGSKEALELRDGESRFMGKGVRKAVGHVVGSIASKLLGQDVCDQNAIDNIMLEADGSDNKQNFGANALLGVSMASAKAAAISQNIPLYQHLANVFNKDAKNSDQFKLPMPLMNVINGGEHADNGLDFQEFMLVPHGFDRFSLALQAGVEVFHTLKKNLKAQNLSTNVGDEGGFAPDIRDSKQALDLLLQSIEQAGYKVGSQISLALDVAASEMYQDNQYLFKKSNQASKSSEQMVDYYAELCELYPIVSIEDPLDENDWDAWKNMQARLGSKIQVVGDDLLVTNPKLLAQGIQDKAANAILIKVNQIGTLTETLECISLAKQSAWNSIVSHRSGETEDSFIADLAVGTQAGQIKTGSASRSDRMAKYNQLLRIEQELGDKAVFDGNLFKK